MLIQLDLSFLHLQFDFFFHLISVKYSSLGLGWKAQRNVGDFLLFWKTITVFIRIKNIFNLGQIKLYIC